MKIRYHSSITTLIKVIQNSVRFDLIGLIWFKRKKQKVESQLDKISIYGRSTPEKKLL